MYRRTEMINNYCPFIPINLPNMELLYCKKQNITEI